MSDIFPRESGWDSSVREEPLGEWCSKHGFYDCPVCRGEEPVWVIPIVDGSEEVGMVTIHDRGEVTISGTVRLPTPLALPPRSSSPLVTPHEPLVATPSPDLIAQVKESFSTVEDLLNEPRHREAAARGRKVHEDALALMEATGLGYAEAIAKVLDERA